MTASTWESHASKLAADLDNCDATFIASASLAEISEKAGDWFGELSENTRASVVATLRAKDYEILRLSDAEAASILVNPTPSERQLTMRAIRMLSRAAEALSQGIYLGMSPDAAKAAANIASRCADRAEHIAQYDDDGMDESSRMSFVAQDMAWLIETVPAVDELLKVGPPFHLSPEDIKEVGKAAWERSGKKPLPLGHQPNW